MGNIYLLDCTLRDGGYLNDWSFGAGSIKSIVSRLDSAGIDIIEAGFVDERCNYDINRSMYPDLISVEPVFKGMKKANAMMVVMIDYGTCSIERIVHKSESNIDGIRVIFKKKHQDEAIEFCKQIKEKGYKVFVNPVSVTTFSDEEMISLVKKVNKLEPYVFTVVDTYGLMHSDKLLHYCNIINTHLNKNIILGYHAHNNFQLAYSNTIAVMENIKDRDISIDGTLFGMGKSAGNACTELVAMYMNERFDKCYDINQIQETIDIDITKEFQKKSWGYRPMFYISALNECHPSYVNYLLGKKTLSVSQINVILSKIPKEKDINLLYDEKLCEQLYQDFQNNEVEDSFVIEKLKQELSGKSILIIGPGRTINDCKSDIDNFICKENPKVFSINFLSCLFPVDYVFMGNSKRYSQFFNTIYEDQKDVKVICTSNISTAKERVDYIVNFAELKSDVESIYDNPLVLFINLAIKLSVKDITLAGFDGYSDDINDCYFTEYIKFLYDKSNVALRNGALKNFITTVKDKVDIKTITPSRYF